jgi:hypothetical protein
VHEALKKFQACWAEAMASDGFVIYCEPFGFSERFRIVPRDFSVLLALLYDHDIDVHVPVTEDDLRAKLARMGLSVDVVNAKIQSAKNGAETLGPHFGPTIRFARQKDGT